MGDKEYALLIGGLGALTALGIALSLAVLVSYADRQADLYPGLTVRGSLAPVSGSARVSGALSAGGAARAAGALRVEGHTLSATSVRVGAQQTSLPGAVSAGGAVSAPELRVGDVVQPGSASLATPPVPAALLRRALGAAPHSVDYAPLTAYHGPSPEFFVDAASGSDSHDGRTRATAVRTVAKALTLPGKLLAWGGVATVRIVGDYAVDPSQHKVASTACSRSFS